MSTNEEYTETPVDLENTMVSFQGGIGVGDLRDPDISYVVALTLISLNREEHILAQLRSSRTAANPLSPLFAAMAKPPQMSAPWSVLVWPENLRRVSLAQRVGTYSTLYVVDSISLHEWALIGSCSIPDL